MDADPAAHRLRAGAAVADLTPAGSVFLYGYPHVPRWSTGVHDRLEVAALHLADGGSSLLILASDLIFVTKPLVARVRERIAAATGVPAANIAISATHTHSGPVTVDYLSNEADPVVPRVDPAYLDLVADRMVEAGVAAVRNAVPAELALVRARAEGVGTNRHDPHGPADPEVPVLLVRAQGGAVLACMVAYAMHPTVLHEDSTLISGDFPHFTRRSLKDRGIVPESGVILYHNGASGNQSPRHVTRANTFAEAQRLGELLGARIAAAAAGARYSDRAALAVARAHLELSPRPLPAVAAARQEAVAAKARFERLRADPAAPRTAVRTAECDVFGAEETATLAEAAASGRLAAAIAASLPAEIQVMRIGDSRFVFWPGEYFVEYALAVRARRPDAFVVTMANGELQGYITTEEAVTARLYEAGNAVFDAANGRRVVEATLALLHGLG